MNADDYVGVRRAAAQGNPLAACYTAVLAALGVGEAQDWRLALRRLGRAAVMDFEPARQQLRIISGEDEPADGWEALALRIELDRWLSPAPVTPISASPQIASVSGFMPPPAAAWLIGRVQGRMSPALVYRHDGEITTDAARTNTLCLFGPGDLDLIVVLVRARLAATFGVTARVLEPLQMLRYEPGQEFKPHTDFLGPATPELQAELAKAGQRVATILGYLNEGYEGGETEFPRLGIRFKGGIGDLLMFRNVDEAGEPDRRTLHAGTAPIRGEKWIFTQWVRER